MIQLNANIPAEIAPLSWLLGVWEGSGIVHYKVGDETREHEFGQRLSFSHDGLPYLNYNSYTWLLGTQESDEVGPTPLVAESGYWRLSRPATDGDPGPGMLPATAAPAYSTVEAVETLRNENGAFDIEVTLVHPGGINELYLGEVKGPRIDLATDAVMRTVMAKEYAAATRIYGLVDSHLLWAWDIAALGQELRTHASARLAKVD